MKKLVSPKQVARAIGVSESTVKRWCDKGLIPMVKTAGGHRKMDVNAVVQFLRDSGHEIVEPQVLGLPVAVGKTGWTLNRAVERIVPAVVQGDESIVRQVVFDLLLAKHSVTTIFDEVLAPVMHEIGERWSCGDVAVYQERRGCEIVMRVLNELRDVIDAPPADAPTAIGATIEGDFYTIPVTMAGIVLRSAGWNATTLGTNLPFATLQEALQQTRPRLIWISTAYVSDKPRFVTGLNDLFEAAQSIGIMIAVGGQALSTDLRRQLQYTTFCESFADLEAFGRSVHSESRSGLSETDVADHV
ncbi:MAG: cobalamin B12-binding domain-containing protein [Planctomycetota bacterium]|jgi:excisionase family DNA binding protein